MSSFPKSFQPRPPGGGASSPSSSSEAPGRYGALGGGPPPPPPGGAPPMSGLGLCLSQRSGGSDDVELGGAVVVDHHRQAALLPPASAGCARVPSISRERQQRPSPRSTDRTDPSDAASSAERTPLMGNGTFGGGGGFLGRAAAAGDFRPRTLSLHDTSPLYGVPPTGPLRPFGSFLSERPACDAARPAPQDKWSRLPPSDLTGGPVVNGVERRMPIGGGGEDEAEERRRREAIRSAAGGKVEAGGKGGFFNYIVYAVINIIISVPGLYGYAAVIFNHPAFESHMNALSKLVIFSSCVHQLGFFLFSSLPFAIGTVQDAGLIFLSAMSNIIADAILNDGGTVEEVVSTTLVILPLGTACLGLVLVVMGRFRLADVVSYLPMPVVGGYLAFIGYFCLMAGVALCISEAMMDLKDWAYLLDPRNVLLAFPGLAAGLVLTWISRKATNDMALPVAMIAVPALFYVVIFATGAGIDGAREGGWVGKEMPPVPVADLFRLIDFSLVRWVLISKCLATWVGMVFVVSFASCLDVAAISMDMGEALDTNRELATVGICNFMSGCTVGFTGSYIFSQTIFTYRTGCHSKWIGVFIMIMFLAVVASTVNFLQVAPLFFLGSTLIFIGYDLLYEWLIEVRHKLLLTEYLVLLATFVAIHIVGIDAGIIFGVIVAVVDYVFTTAKVSSLTRVQKRSRAVWKPEDWKLLDAHGYHPKYPKIITFELKGSVFFGSSLQLLSNITDQIGVDATAEDKMDLAMASPHRGAYLLTAGDRSPSSGEWKRDAAPLMRSRPLSVVLDLADMNNLDASAARGCFLQLAKMCAKRGIVVCASGANPRVDWMLRSHGVACATEEEEEEAKRKLLGEDDGGGADAEPRAEKVILFLTLYEALEFCEMMLIEKLTRQKIAKKPSFVRLDELVPPSPQGSVTKQTLSQVFSHILGLSEREAGRLIGLDGVHEEAAFKGGDVIFEEDTHPDAFGVVLRGGVATIRGEDGGSRLSAKIVSGAGPVKVEKSSSQASLFDGAESLGEVKAILQVGAIFGYVDFLLDRMRSFRAVAAQDGTTVAMLTRTRLDRLKLESPELLRVVQSVLLQASAMELANCTCCE